MRQDAMWRAFAETGEPVYYLLYRAIEAAGTGKNETAHGKPVG